MKKKNPLRSDYVKPRQSRYYVPTISKKVTKQALKTHVNRYIQTMRPLNTESYVVEAKKVLAIAETKEPKFTMGIDAPEAHKMAIRINAYMEAEAKRNGVEFTQIDHEIVLKSFVRMRKVYRNLLLYFRGSPGAYDINKGIYIHGGTGSGKTLVLEVFKEYTKMHLQANSFRMVEASKIHDAAIKREINALDEFIRVPITHTPINLYIEDFGASEKHVKWMGNKIEPMGELIMRRYRYYKKYGTLTHVCTNIRPGDLPNHFGPRVCSRFSEMFNIVNFNLFDWRKI